MQYFSNNHLIRMMGKINLQRIDISNDTLEKARVQVSKQDPPADHSKAIPKRD